MQFSVGISHWRGYWEAAGGSRVCDLGPTKARLLGRLEAYPPVLEAIEGAGFARLLVHISQCREISEPVGRQLGMLGRRWRVERNGSHAGTHPQRESWNGRAAHDGLDCPATRPAILLPATIWTPVADASADPCDRVAFL